jgi:hypothetical protein
MANITGTVKSVFNSHEASSNIGCAVVHDTAANIDEAIVFWNGTGQNNRRIYFNSVFLTALGTGKTVSITTTGPVSGLVESISIS